MFLLQETNILLVDLGSIEHVLSTLIVYEN